MAQTLFAAFNDPAQAEKAAGALLDHGANKEDLSLVTRENTTSDYENRQTTENWGNAYVPVAGSSAGAAGTAPGYGINAPVDVRGTGSVGVANRNDLDSDYDEDVDDADHMDASAKGGISTTTSSDAGSGAAKGAGIGLGLGILGGIASLIVPGVGLVLGGGALATAIGAAAATTAAGAVAGGVTGYLKDQGVPDETAAQYNRNIEGGGAMLALSVPSGKLDAATAQSIVEKYGGGNIDIY